MIGFNLGVTGASLLGAVGGAVAEALQDTQQAGSVALRAYDTGETGTWANLANAVADDATFTEVSVSTNTKVTGLRFTMGANAFSVPANSRIDGVTLNLEVQSPDGSGGRYYIEGVCLSFGGSSTVLHKYSTASVAPFRPVGTGVETITLGGDCWGGVLTPDMVNNANFGIDLRLRHPSNNTSRFRIVRADIVVDYTTNSLSDAAFDIIHAVVDMRPELINNNTQTISIPHRGGATAFLAFTTETTEASRTTSEIATADQSPLYLNVGAWTANTFYDVSTGYIADGTSYVNPSNRPPRFQRSDTFLFNTGSSSFALTGIDEISTFSNDERVFHLILVPIYADQAHLVSPDGNDLDGSLQYTAAPGFEATDVICINGQQRLDSGSHGSWVGWGIGHAAPDGVGGFNQSCIAIQQIFAWAGTGVPVKGVAYSATDSIAWMQNSQELANYIATIASPTATGWTITVTDEGAGGGIVSNWGASFLSLRFSGGRSLTFGFGTSPASTGQQTIDFGVSGTPDAALMVGTLMPTIGEYGTALMAAPGSDTAGGFAFIGADSARTYTMAARGELDVTTVTSENQWRQGASIIKSEVGTTVIETGAFDMASGGVSATFTAASSGVWFGLFST